MNKRLEEQDKKLQELKQKKKELDLSIERQEKKAY